jgi:hypothetical protein
MLAQRDEGAVAVTVGRTRTVHEDDPRAWTAAAGFTMQPAMSFFPLVNPMSIC